MQIRIGPPPLPREHGAWAMLLTPPIVAVLVRGISLWGMLAVVGWFFGYAMRGPLEVLTGKGASGRAGMASADPPVARFWLVAFGVLAVLLLLPVVLKHPAILLLLAGALLLVTAVFWLAQHGETRSFLAGFLAVTGLMAGAPLYFLAADGAVSPDGWAVAYVCFAFFCGSIFRVKTMARERRHRAFHGLSIAVHLGFLLLAAAAAALRWVPALLPLALVAPLAWSISCAWRAREGAAANLGRVGMAEVWLTLLFAALVSGAMHISI